MKIVVIEAIGLHLGYLGCYGNDWVSTPNLDRLAANGIVFDQHFADNPQNDGPQTCCTGCYCFPLSEGNKYHADPITPSLAQVLGSSGIPFVQVRYCKSGNHFDPGLHHPVRRLLGAAKSAFSRVAALDQWLLWIDLAPMTPPWQLSEESVDLYFLEKSDDQE